MEFDLERYGKRFVWGVLFVTFHINLGMFSILPEWFGWYMCVSSIVRIRNSMLWEKANECLTKAIRYGRVTLCISLVSRLITLLQIDISPYGMSIIPIVLFLEMVFFHYVMRGVAMNEQDETYEKKAFYYMICMLMVGVGSFFTAIAESVFSILFAIIIFILRFWIAFSLKSVCKEDHDENDSEIEESGE